MAPEDCPQACDAPARVTLSSTLFIDIVEQKRLKPVTVALRRLKQYNRARELIILHTNPRRAHAAPAPPLARAKSRGIENSPKISRARRPAGNQRTTPATPEPPATRGDPKRPHTKNQRRNNGLAHTRAPLRGETPARCRRAADAKSNSRFFHRRRSRSLRWLSRIASRRAARRRG